MAREVPLTNFSRMKRNVIRLRSVVSGSAACVFDIVNGFLIDAVAHGLEVYGPRGSATLTDVYLAEIILRAIIRRQAFMQACR